MSRPLFVAIASAGLLAAGYALGANAGDQTASAVSLLSILAICISAAGAATGIYAAMRAKRTQADVERLARSIDTALRGLAEDTSRNSSTLGALTDTIDRQIGGMLDRIDVATSSRPDAASGRDPVAPSNVVALGAPGRRQSAQKTVAAEVTPSNWSPHGELELSLEPIIAVSQSAAAGFEVYANLPFADGVARPVRRLRGGADMADRARFEFALVKAAMQASRRQLPGGAAKLPLHVAVSEALLADADAAGEIAQSFELHPGLARGLVLSMPAEILAGPTRSQQKVVARLADAGVRFAAEGWPEAAAGATTSPATGGATILKLTCNRLLDRDKVKRKAHSGSDLAEIAHENGMTVIATEVATDEDAVALLDLGVDLMSGTRFSPPRRLRTSPTENAGKAAGG